MHDYLGEYSRSLEIFQSKNLIDDPKPKILDSLQEEIIKNKDYSLAYFFALTFNYKNYLMQKVVMDSLNANYIFLYASKINNSDIKSLEISILKTKNIKVITEFACFIPKISVDKFKKVILKSKNPKSFYMFIKHINSNNINLFKDVLIKSGKGTYLFELSKHIKSKKDIELIEDALIKSKSYTYIRLLAKNNKLANLEKLEEFIMNSGNIKEMKKFAKDIKQSKMRNFLIAS